MVMEDKYSCRFVAVLLERLTTRYFPLTPRSGASKLFMMPLSAIHFLDSLCNRSVTGVGKLEEMHCLHPGKETIRRLIVNPGCVSSAENVSQKTINPITDDPVEAS